MSERFAIPIRQSIRASDLLALERCSAPCLLAAEDGACDCRCGGEFHGALTDAEVTVDPEQWHARAILRAAGASSSPGMPGTTVTRHELQALPLLGRPTTLRLRVAMLAWDCDAREAARRLGLPRSTYYNAMNPSSELPASDRKTARG